jgi:hypothetical protein
VFNEHPARRAATSNVEPRATSNNATRTTDHDTRGAATTTPPHRDVAITD